MAQTKQFCARLYTHPMLFASVLLVTAGATFFRVRGVGGVNGHALAHWLINYEEGFIKRGLMGTLFQLRAVSEFTGIPVETWYLGWVNFFLVLLYLVILFVCWKIFSLNRHWAYAVAPYFIAGPFLISNTSFMGYFDQIVALMVILVAFSLMKERILLAAILAGASVFIHENTVLLVLPLYGYWIFLEVCLARDHKPINYRRIMREAVLPIVTIGCFLAVYFYYEQILSQQEKADYITRTIAPYEAFRRGPESIIRTLTTTYGDWWGSEHEAVFYRFIDVYGGITILLPLLVISWCISQTLTDSVVRQRIYFGVIYPLMLFPLSIFLMAFDVYRFWTFPVVLALVFIYLLLKRGMDGGALIRVVSYRALRWGMALATIYAILCPWPYDDISLSNRCLWYSPLFFWYVCYLMGAGTHEADSIRQAQRGH